LHACQERCAGSLRRGLLMPRAARPLLRSAGWLHAHTGAAAGLPPLPEARTKQQLKEGRAASLTPRRGAGAQNDLQAMSRAHRIGQTETVNIYRRAPRSAPGRDHSVQAVARLAGL